MNKKDYDRLYRIKHKLERKIYYHNFWLKNKAKKQAYNKQYHIMNSKKISVRKKEISIQYKKECFNAYGGCICLCCGEKELMFLSLDHVFNDGSVERRKLGGKRGYPIYALWRARNYPDKDRYQVLCMNCQFGKKLNNGICPHKKNEN